MGPLTILCLNSGSSSLKFTLYRTDGNGHWTQEQHGELHGDETEKFASGEMPRADAVGHRVVHGGLHHYQPERVTVELVASLKDCIPLAPLHLPAQIAAMERILQSHSSLPQVACFDTAFHHNMLEVAQRLPLPRHFFDEGVRKYGFHGLSYEYIVQKLGADAKGAVIIAHLGNGSSLAAVRDGHPVDTSMGLTPSGGVMMGTRPGDLDPGVLLYLMNARGYDGPRLATLIEQECGLLGVSGATNDVRDLLALAASSAEAAQAIEMYCYLVRKQIGALAAALGGLDLLVFTGGIGEHSPEIRNRICGGLEFLGVGSRCPVRVIPTDEDLMIARHTAQLLFP